MPYAQDDLSRSKGFLCPQRTSSTAIFPVLDWATSMSRQEIPIASTFHSILERAALDVLLRGSCPLILVLARRPYKILPTNIRSAVESGRMSIISVVEAHRISTGSASIANQYICQQAKTLTFGFLSHESSLYPLFLQAVGKGKKIDILAQNCIFSKN